MEINQSTWTLKGMVLTPRRMRLRPLERTSKVRLQETFNATSTTRSVVGTKTEDVSRPSTKGSTRDSSTRGITTTNRGRGIGALLWTVRSKSIVVVYAI